MSSTLVTQQAPDFTAKAIMHDNSVNDQFHFSDYIKNHYAVLFFYPLDFTFVCPSEIIAFDKKLEEFQKRGAVVISVSIDSHYTHLAYKNTPIKEGGIGHIKFPMVADITKNISRQYGVLINDAISLRATFIIDKNGVIRHQSVNDLQLGRDIDKTLGTLDAVIHNDQYGEVCPANWQKGEEAMRPTTEGVKEYLAKKHG